MSVTRRQFLRRLPPLTAAASAGLAGCRRAEPAPLYNYELPDVPVQVTATTAQLADLAAEIGGDAVAAASLIPRGKSPHHWEANAADVAALRMADVALLNGLGLEKGLAGEREALEKSGVLVVSADASLPPERVIHPAGADGPPDPHVWMSPALWTEVSRAVERTLKDAFPPAANYFAARAHDFRVDLEKISSWGLKLFQELPEEKRRFFTSQDTFAYFASEFGLDCRALRPAGAPLPKEISAGLRQWLEERGVKTLFREEEDVVAPLSDLCRPLGIRPDYAIFNLTLAPEGTKLLSSFAELNVSRLTGALRYTIDLIKSQLVLA